VKLVRLVGFITKKFVTMHGHMNVKFVVLRCGPKPNCTYRQENMGPTQ